MSLAVEPEGMLGALITGASRLMVLPAWLLLTVTVPVEDPVLMFVALFLLSLIDVAPSTRTVGASRRIWFVEPRYVFVDPTATSPTALMMTSP